jgi:hypothetical protein
MLYACRNIGQRKSRTNLRRLFSNPRGTKQERLQKYLQWEFEDGLQISRNSLKIKARQAGLEPVTLGLEADLSTREFNGSAWVENFE